MNKLKLAFPVLLLILLTACRMSGIPGSGAKEKEKRNIGEFTKLSAAGAFNIEVKVGTEASLEIQADDNLLELIRTEVSNYTLRIDTKRDINPRGEIRIWITVKELEEVSSAGANNIDVYNISSDRFFVDMSGAGNVNLEGNTGKLDVELSGAANIEAGDLKAEDVEVSVSGACNATVYASERLDASVSGVGNVSYYGNPEKVNSSVSGVGSIKRK